jgi:hypothetical protein
VQISPPESAGDVVSDEKQARSMSTQRFECWGLEMSTVSMWVG